MSGDRNKIESAAAGVDETVKRIRSKIRSGAAGNGKNESPEQIENLRQSIVSKTQQSAAGEIPWADVGDLAGSSRASTSRLTPLARDVGEMLTAHRQVGQLNPRRPGLHNRAIQLVKQTMRRSLSWYTRPLQLFQSAVISAMQRVTAVLQLHDDVLQQHNDLLQRTSQEIARQSAAIEELRQQNAQLAEQLAAQGVAQQAISEEPCRPIREKQQGDDPPH